MRLRPHLLSVAVLAVSAAGPAPASAQTGDPEAGSPSGVIYEIPLDNARRDAAPTRTGGGKGGGTSGSGGGTTSGSGSGSGSGAGGVTTANGTVSPIHSENGFGSSSAVPGVAAAVAAKLSGKSGGKKAGSRKSSGSTKTPVMTSPAESLGPPKSATVTATPSKSRAYLLLALALAVAAGIGVAGRYVARRR